MRYPAAGKREALHREVQVAAYQLRTDAIEVARLVDFTDRHTCQSNLATLWDQVHHLEASLHRFKQAVTDESPTIVKREWRVAKGVW